MCTRRLKLVDWSRVMKKFEVAWKKSAQKECRRVENGMHGATVLTSLPGSKSMVDVAPA